MGAADAVVVSVVMIFRDSERFFDEAVESVLVQTQPGVELLLCDDGSGPASTQIARRWAAAHPDRVRYLDHPDHAHRGMSATRNLGVDHASGELVAFLDSDDVWEAGHLAHEVALLQAHPDAGLVCGQALYWSSWDDPDAPDLHYPLPWPPGVVVEAPQMLLALMRRGTYRTPTCSLLVRRSVLLAVGGSEDAFRGQYEDQVLLAKLYLTHPAVISGTATARYRHHGGSATALALRNGSDSDDRPNASREAFLRWLDTRPQLRNPTDPATQQIRTLLDHALTPYDHTPTRSRWQAKTALRNATPNAVKPLLRAARHHTQTLGLARLNLHRSTPLSRNFGAERGQPIDRYYIEKFLTDNAHTITGHTLEIGDATYTHRYGTNITKADVLNINPGHPDTTIVADLTRADHIPDHTYDCLLITQTLHLIYDLPAAVNTLHRILKPGGTLLTTFPGISALATDQWAHTWYWSLTPLAATRLFHDFDPHTEITAHGNLTTTTAFLNGHATHELRPHHLDTPDPQYPMLITVRALKPLA